ncbi:MAG: glycosyl hydrolase 108 family protein [Verrucomicrobiota bacterium]
MDFTFDAYFAWLIPWEGEVFENVPGDPGGATKYGIDQRSHPGVNIRALTKDQAKAIYRSDYWLPVSADKLPPRIAWAVMDCAVNCGKSRAAKWLQMALGVKQDGVIGPKTLHAAAQYSDLHVAADVLLLRDLHYRELGKTARFSKFLKGWINRNKSLRATITK